MPRLQLQGNYLISRYIYINSDDLYCISTAVPISNIHKDEILDSTQFPYKYTAYSVCFRREAGSYGKDTRGLLRLSI